MESNFPLRQWSNIECKIKPEELSENGYVLLYSPGHKELTPFAWEYIKKRTLFSLMYPFKIIIIAGIIVFRFWINFGTDNFKIGNAFAYFSY